MANHLLGISRVAPTSGIVQSRPTVFNQSSLTPNLPLYETPENSDLHRQSAGQPPEIGKTITNRHEGYQYQPVARANYDNIGDSKDPDLGQSRYVSDARIGHDSAASSQPLVSGSGTTADFGRSNSDHLGSSLGTPPSFTAVTIPTGQCLKNYLSQNYETSFNYNSNISSQHTAVMPVLSQFKELSKDIGGSLTPNLNSQDASVADVPAEHPPARPDPHWRREAYLSPPAFVQPFMIQNTQDNSHYRMPHMPYVSGIHPSRMVDHVHTEQLLQSTGSYDSRSFPLKVSASPLGEAHNHHHGTLLNRRAPKNSIITDSLGEMPHSIKVQNGQDANHVDLMAARKLHKDWKLKNLPHKKQKGLCDCCA